MATNQQTGTGFTNIQNLLAANKNNQLGQTIGGGITNAATGVQQDIGNQQQDFTNQLNQSNTALQNDTSSRNDILNRAENAQSPTDISANDASQYQGYANQTYGGPTGLGDVTTLQNKAQEAQGLGQATQTQAGKFGLLQRFLTPSSGNYTEGQQNLDNLLLGQSGGNDLKNARRATVGLGSQVNSAQGSAQNQASGAQANTQQFATDTGNLANTAYQNSYNPAQQSYQNAQNYYTNTVQPLSANLQNKSLTPQQAALLGIGSTYTSYNVNPSQYFSTEAAPTLSSVTSSPQQAQIQALAQLSGQTSPTFDASQAGKYDPNNAYTFNYGGPNGFQQAVAGQAQGYMNDINQIPTLTAQYLKQQIPPSVAMGMPQANIEQAGAIYAKQLYDAANAKWNPQQTVSGANQASVAAMPDVTGVYSPDRATGDRNSAGDSTIGRIATGGVSGLGGLFGI